MYRVGVIGVGRGGQGIGTHSIGYAHAYAYQHHDRSRIVAAADISSDNLNRFGQEFSVDSTYQDYRQMLFDAKLDIVSISAYVGTRREMVLAAIDAGIRAIWCEKPLALSMDDGRWMVDLCRQRGVRLVVNHWRRYLPGFRDAKRMMTERRIGAPIEFFATIPAWDLMGMGTHWFDLFRFFAGDQPVSWVMGQVRCTGDRKFSGQLMEEHGVAVVGFADGTRGVLDCGWGSNLGNVVLRLIGTDGLIDLADDGTLRVVDDAGLHVMPAQHARGKPAFHPMVRVLQELIQWTEGGAAPEVSGPNALLSAELYLAAYESSLRGDRVDIPLTAQSRFPLDAIVEGRRTAIEGVADMQRGVTNPRCGG